MRVLLSIFSLLIFLNIPVFGQSNIFLNETDSIFVQVSKNSIPFYNHKIRAGETIYSLAKFFSADYKDLMILNAIDQTDIIPLGTEIKIPLNTEELIKSGETTNSAGIPVFYSVKKSENLFRISHVFFNQTIGDLVQRNKLHSLSLKPDQILKVGWWPYMKAKLETTQPQIFIKDTVIASTIIPDTLIDQNIDSLIQESQEDSLLVDFSIDSLTTSETFDIKSVKGIAIWERTDENDESLLVLHKSAKVGSVIKLQNPVTEIITVAQVVGNIPENVYTNDIDIVVSKAVAQKLGALDTRFQILMTFYE